MKLCILGGGLSGVSLAYFLQNNPKIKQIDIFEKSEKLGGLASSFQKEGIYYDIGPHIIFSKDKEVLDLMKNLLGKNINKLRRSNKIFYKGRFVKYPFENELSALPEKDREYCLNAFLHNPYENYETGNMLQFFLKTFGEGITNTYLSPYNEKIWKFGPSFMDTQMVERIPKPPREDIINSAKGETTEGYAHQLNFHYPKKGGIETLIKAFANKFNVSVNVIVNSNVTSVQKINNKWTVKTDTEVFDNYDLLISSIPVPSLLKAYKADVPNDIVKAIGDLKYNSIIITIINVRKDNLGNHFAVNIPDKNIIFHRVSKLNFLGDSYCKKDGSVTLMIEITYQKNSLIDKMDNEDIMDKILDDLEELKFIDTRKDVNFTEARRFEYAYVIYDLNHRKNMDLIKGYFTDHGIALCGRFGEFEYINMDAVIRHAKNLTEKLEIIK